MTAGGKHIHTQFLNIDRQMANGLYRIGVERNFVRLCNGGQFFDGLNGADLVIGGHDGDQFGIGTNGGLQLLRGDQTLGIYFQIGGGAPLFFQCRYGVQNGMVFDVGGNNVSLFLFKYTKQCHIVTLRTARGKEDLTFFGTDALGNGATGIDDGLLGDVGNRIHTGHVAVIVCKIRHHCLNGFGTDFGGGSVVYIDHFVHKCFAFLFYNVFSCGNGKSIASFIHRMSCVALDPYKRYLMGFKQWQQPLPQINIECRFFVSLFPAAGLPTVDPALIDRFTQITGIAVQCNLTGFFQSFQSDNGAQQFHTVVGGVSKSFGKLLGHTVIFKYGAVAARTGIAAAGTVGINIDLFHYFISILATPPI